jgi:lysophospholipase L1-like esterase
MLELPRTRSLRGAGVNVANFFESLERHFEYLEKKDVPGICRIVAEGDSWFLHPLLEDTLDWLGKNYAISCLSAAGDRLREMLMQNDFVSEIVHERPQFFLLSGGGNDILGAESFKYCLKRYSQGEAGQSPARLIRHLFYDKRDEVLYSYRRVFRRIAEDPDIARLYDAGNPLHILIHGYDYVIPGIVRKGQWLRVKMMEKGIRNPLDHNAIPRYLIDRLNEGLESLVGEYAQTENFRVHYVNLRGTLEQKANNDIFEQKELWYDEIHPNSEGYKYVAARFQKKIEDLRNTAG